MKVCAGAHPVSPRGQKYRCIGQELQVVRLKTNTLRQAPLALQVTLSEFRQEEWSVRFLNHSVWQEFSSIRQEKPSVRLPDATKLHPDVPKYPPDARFLLPDAPVLVPDATFILPDVAFFLPERLLRGLDMPLILPEATVPQPDVPLLHPDSPFSVTQTRNQETHPYARNH